MWVAPRHLQSRLSSENAPSGRVMTLPSFSGQTVRTRPDAAVLLWSCCQDASGRPCPLVVTPSGCVRTFPSSCGHTVRTRQDAPVTFRGCTEDGRPFSVIFTTTRPDALSPFVGAVLLKTSCQDASGRVLL